MQCDIISSPSPPTTRIRGAYVLIYLNDDLETLSALCKHTFLFGTPSLCLYCLHERLPERCSIAQPRIKSPSMAEHCHTDLAHRDNAEPVQDVIYIAKRR